MNSGNSGGGNPRRVRVASSMRELLASMLDRDVKDPRVRAAGFVSVNHVELNSDMSVAHVYVSFLSAGGGDSSSRAIANAMAGLGAASRYLRGPVARRLKLRHAPDLRFVADDSPAFQQRLRDLVRADDAAREQAGEPASEQPSGQEPGGQSSDGQISDRGGRDDSGTRGT